MKPFLGSHLQLEAADTRSVATEMGAMEHLLNVYASKSAKNSIAKFVGYAQVMPEEATRSLTQGLWLVSHRC